MKTYNYSEWPKIRIGLKCVECGKPATDPHHVYGSRNNKEVVIPVCRVCHHRIETDRKWAMEKGYRRPFWEAPYKKKGKGKRPTKSYNIF